MTPSGQSYTGRVLRYLDAAAAAELLKLDAAIDEALDARVRVHRLREADEIDEKLYLVGLRDARKCEAHHETRRQELIPKWLYRSRAMVVRECDVCGLVFEPARDDAKTCSPACRQRAYRARGGAPAVPTMARRQRRRVTDARAIGVTDDPTSS